MTPPPLAGRLADLAVGVGANVQPGQIVTVSADLGMEEVVREVVAAAYRRGAQFVDVAYFDPRVKRARIERADGDTLDFVPPWYGERVRALGRCHSARIVFTAPSDPEALRGLDSERLGRDPLPALAEWMEVLEERTVNWTIVPYPTMTWARLVYPELDDEAALEQLQRDVVHVCRLDEADPAAAWRSRTDELSAVGARLTALHLDALHFDGPGTDLTIGLLPSSAWMGAMSRTIDGLEHLPNVPTEEVFTTPDPERAEGVVRSAKPLVLVDGTLVRGLEVRFEGAGRSRSTPRRASNDAGADGARRGRVAARGSGTRRPGEPDRPARSRVLRDVAGRERFESHRPRVGPRGGCREDDVPRVNRSAIHIDFMVGGDDVDVTGITPAASAYRSSAAASGRSDTRRATCRTAVPSRR